MLCDLTCNDLTTNVPPLPPSGEFQVRLYPTGEPGFSLATPLQGNGTFVFHRIPPDSYTVSIDDASDLALTPKNDQGLRYDERTVVQKYRPVSKNIDVGDRDLDDVVLSVAPIR